MVTMEHGVFLLLSLLCFVSLPINRLGGPGNTKIRGFCRYTNVLMPMI